MGVCCSAGCLFSDYLRSLYSYLRRSCLPGSRWLLLLAWLTGALSLAASPPAQGQSPPVSHGHWLIALDYTGSATSSVVDPEDRYAASINNVSVPPNSTIQLNDPANGVVNLPQYTETGGLRGFLKADLVDSIFQGGMMAAGIDFSSAAMRFKFLWKPDNNDFINNPAPDQLVICYRRQVVSRASLGINDGTIIKPPFGGASAYAQIDGLHSLRAGVTLSIPPLYNYDERIQDDPDFVVETIYLAGASTEKIFHLSGSLGGSIDLNGSVILGTLSTETIWSVDLCLPGFDKSRFDHMSGNRQFSSSDPSFTRWLPLAFSPVINSQPIRTQPGPLPAPWGNLNCMYAMTLRQEPNPPNNDLNNTSLLYLPSPGPDGYNTPQAPFQILTYGAFLPTYALTDTNGDRLVFDHDWKPYTDIYSGIQPMGNGTFQLKGAGPPGSLKQAGEYTYIFQTVRPDPLLARLVAIDDQEGNRQSLFWNDTDPQLPALTVSDRTSGRRLLFYTGWNGYLSAVDAPLLNSTDAFTHTTLSYDGDGHLTDSKVFDGRTGTIAHSDHFAYGGFPNADAIVDSQQGVSVTHFTYIADWQTIDPFGSPFSRLASVTYGDFNDTSSSSNGQSIQGTYSYTYGPQQEGYNDWGVTARTDSVEDALGNKTWRIFGLTYGGFGPINRLQMLGQAYADQPTNSNTVTTVYSPDINRPRTVSLTDPYTYLWQATFDPDIGVPTSFTDPFSHQWRFEYENTGYLLTAVTDPTDLVSGFRYGENGNPHARLTSVLNPSVNALTADALLQLNYNQFGQLASATVPASVSAAGQEETALFAYHPVTGDLIGVTDPLGDRLTVNAHDPLGDPLSFSVYPDTGDPATSQNPLTTSIAYDAAQMPTWITDPNGIRLITTYTNGVARQFDLVDTNPLADPNVPLAQLRLSYDTRGRMYRASDLAGLLSGYLYDKNSNRTHLFDGLGNTTRFEYGHNNELTRLFWPDRSVVFYGYDRGGRLTKVTDERQVVTTYDYDRANRLTDVWCDGQQIHNEYDAANRLLWVEDATGGRTYTYDRMTKRLQRVTTVFAALPAGQNTFTVAYTYYVDGKLRTMTTPVGTFTYTYSQGGQLMRLSDNWGNATAWTYDHAGRATGETTTTTAGVALASAYTYEAPTLGLPSTQLNVVALSRANQPFWTYRLGHSPLAQITSQQGTGAQPAQSDSLFLNYDARGRLRSEEATYRPDAQTFAHQAGVYTYDLANNLQSSQGPLGPGGWEYNENNQVTSAPFLAAQGGLAGASNLRYDASGNTRALNGNTLDWNGWGRLNRVTGPDVIATYTYDAAGRRVSKTVSGQTTYYLYSGDTLLCELDSNGNVLHGYTWGALGLISDLTPTAPGSRSLTRPTLPPGMPTYHYYLFDGLGNTRFVLDADGAVVSQGAYTAWGNVLTPSYPNTPFSWKGRWGAYYDRESDLFCLGARYYAAGLGRFLSRDPSGYAAGPNLYAYCACDPINLFDVTGWEPDSAEQANEGLGLRVGNLIDDYLLGGATKEFGNTAGRYDAGKASGAELAWSATKWGVQLGQAAFLVKDAGQLAWNVGKKGFSMARAWKGGGCFPAGTPVQIAVSASPNAAQQDKKSSRSKAKASKAKKASRDPMVTRSVEQVRAGDLVVSRNERTGQTELKRVERTTVRTVDVLVQVALADAKTAKLVDTLTATREHPFYVDGKGFVPAGGLAVGNAIVTRAGPPLVVQSIQWLRRPEGYRVYNFVVEGDHTYFVGNAHGGAWVHNPGSCANGGLFDPDELGELTAPTRRGDLRDRMLEEGPPPTPNAQAHHELPWELKDDFAERGVNVNDPEFGKWVDPDNHQIWNEKYNSGWKLWLKNHPEAGPDDIRAFLDRLRATRRWGGNYL